jgi:chemotaxis protein methyltransferase CheR
VTALKQVAELVRLESGIALRPGQHRALEAAIRRAAPGLDADAFLRLATEPLGGRALVQKLVDEVTIQESSFLRDRRQLGGLDWDALAEAAGAAEDRRARIWVAGCATGEEAYTLVLLACEELGTTNPPLDVLGTDISKAALAAAAEGRYRKRSVVEIEAQLLERYFIPDGTRFAVGPTLRGPVRFLHHNLARDPVPPLGESRFDLIVCRNVLIYFDGPTIEQVIGALERALCPTGMLLLGAADALHGAARRLADATTPRQPAAQKPSRQPSRDPEELLAAALDAADRGRRRDALDAMAELLEQEPLNAEAYFVRGMVELAGGASADAVESLRRALYIDPNFSTAAFTLGRAYDELAEREAALRAYTQALRALDPTDERHAAILREVDLGDIAAACRMRIEALE